MYSQNNALRNPIRSLVQGAITRQAVYVADAARGNPPYHGVWHAIERLTNPAVAGAPASSLSSRQLGSVGRGETDHDNIHVRGYKEEGTITTPFDMTVLNDLDRFHLVMDTIDRLPQTGERGAVLKQKLGDKLVEHRRYIESNGQDLPEIRDWRWGAHLAVLHIDRILSSPLQRARRRRR